MAARTPISLGGILAAYPVAGVVKAPCVRIFNPHRGRRPLRDHQVRPTVQRAYGNPNRKARYVDGAAAPFLMGKWMSAALLAVEEITGI
jgi:hypothetical protein